MKNFPIFLLIAFMSLTFIKGSHDHYEIHPKGIICTILDKKLVTSYICKSKNLNQTVNMASKELIFQPGVVLTDVHVEYQVYYKFRTEFRPYLVKLHEDYCNILNGSSPLYNKILNLNALKIFGNFYEPCPFYGRRFFANVTSGYDKALINFPEILPAGEYRVDDLYYALINGEKRPFIVNQNFGDIKVKTALQWKK